MAPAFAAVVVRSQVWRLLLPQLGEQRLGVEPGTCPGSASHSPQTASRRPSAMNANATHTHSHGLKFGHWGGNTGSVRAEHAYSGTSYSSTTNRTRKSPTATQRAAQLAIV